MIEHAIRVASEAASAGSPRSSPSGAEATPSSASTVPPRRRRSPPARGPPPEPHRHSPSRGRPARDAGAATGAARAIRGRVRPRPRQTRRCAASPMTAGRKREVRDHARRIVDGVAAERDAIDDADRGPGAGNPGRRARKCRARDPPERDMGGAILRRDPGGETINDAVSLARIYAGDAARRLVNGVLGSVSRSSGGGDRKA